MKKVVLGIKECKEGMKIAETLFNEYGAVIVAENTILDEHLIRKLDNLNIVKVKIFNESDKIIAADSSELFKAQYNENMEVIKELLHEISTGQNVDFEKVSTVSDSIVERINENRDIVGCIN